MKRIVVAGLCCSVAIACDPVRQVGIVVVPRPAIVSDSMRQLAFDIAARVSGQHGLAPLSPSQEERWQQCFRKTNISVCGRPIEGGVDFLLYEVLAAQWSAAADTIRRELLGHLTSAFGSGAVRECRWRESRSPRKSGCPPVTARDSTS